MYESVPRRRRAALPIVCAILWTLAACGAPPQAAAPSPPPSAAPAAALSPSPSAAPSPSPLPSPSHSPVPPTPSPSPLPSPSHSPVPPTPSPEDPPIGPALAAELQRILDDLVRDGTIPGATLAVHVPGHQPWSGASGLADREAETPLTADTRMRIASISKVFTAVVVLQLVEERAIGLDQPLADWYPGLVPGAERVTVRRLLQHTTGLYDYLEDASYLSTAYAAPDRQPAPGELVEYAARQTPLFAPGAPGAWDYSSTNYVLLGMIVEAATGGTLAEAMRARIFEPLGLERTFFAPDEQVLGAQARGYRRQADVTAVAMGFAFATANLVSTPSDVRRFGDALFGGELLRPETMALMQTFVDGNGQYNMPDLEYGLGLMRNRLPVGPDAQGRARPAAERTVLGHTGGFAGFRSALWHAPASGATIALGMNQAATDPNILAARVLDAILDAEGK